MSFNKKHNNFSIFWHFIVIMFLSYNSVMYYTIWLMPVGFYNLFLFDCLFKLIRSIVTPLYTSLWQVIHVLSEEYVFKNAFYIMLDILGVFDKNISTQGSNSLSMWKLNIKYNNYKLTQRKQLIGNRQDQIKTYLNC